jgi:hypothetical protein
LVLLGYQAALFTPSQFIHGNRHTSWPESFGSKPVDMNPQGLCLIPRLVMSHDWRADVSIAAFLRQPIVLAGHHHDLFRDLDLLSEITAHVNRLGHVRWCNLSAIASSRFTSRQEGSSLVIRLGARTVECHVPQQVTEVIIERPWVRSSNEPITLCGVAEAREPMRLSAGTVSGPIPWNARGDGKLSIDSPPTAAVDYRSVPHPSERIWPVIRKVLVEARDRSYSLLPRTVQRVHCSPDLRRKSSYRGQRKSLRE